MLNASKTCPWKCGGGQAGGGEVQHATSTGAPRVGLWDELHSKEVSVFLNYLHSTANFKNVRSKCLNKQGTLSSDDQHGRPIRARTTLLYARD